VLQHGVGNFVIHRLHIKIQSSKYC